MENRVTLGQLIESGAILSIQDGNHGEKHPTSADYVTNGIPFIMASDIIGGRIDFERCKRISRELADTLRIGFSKTGDVLLTHKGTLGNVALVPDVSPFVMLTPQVTYYRTNEKLLHNKYLVYAFREPNFQGRMKRFSDQSTRPYVGITNQKYLSIPHPPIPIQQRIAGILSAYDDLIENNLKRIKLLEEMAQITYEEWFVRLRFPGHESTTINPETGLPEGWKQKQLADYFPIKTGKKDANIQTADGQYPFFTCSQGTYRTDVYSFDAEAIILAGNGEFNIKYYRGKFEAYQRNYVLIPNDSDLLFLLFLFMKYYLYQITAGSKGAVIKYLTKDMIANTKFQEPTIGVLAAFNDIIVPFFYEIENLEKQNQRLREACDILLPRLMTGMIDVESYNPTQILKEAI